MIGGDPVYGSLFCQLYNDFGWNEYPRALGRRILTWLDGHGLRPARALDLGCGTGMLCAVLTAGGVAADGLDLSPDMIDVAKTNYPGLAFTVGDMTDFTVEHRYDLVTCTGDALNHIFDPDAVGRAFACVRRALNDGGVFLFDLLDPDEVPAGEPFEAEHSDGTRVRFETVTDGRDVRLTIKTYEGDALKFEENILERVHDLGDILARLERAGFEVVQCTNRLLDTDGSGTTRFIAARAI